MPIPWLIGAAVIAAGAAIASAISDDEKPSSNSSSDDEELRLRKKMEKERRKRERTQKQEAAQDQFKKRGSDFGKSLAKALPSDFMDASSRNNFSIDFNLNNGHLKFDNEEASHRDPHLFYSTSSLEVILAQNALSKKIIENLLIFSELYKPDFQCHSELYSKREKIMQLDDSIQQLNEIRNQIIKLGGEVTSAQVRKGP